MWNKNHRKSFLVGCRIHFWSFHKIDFSSTGGDWKNTEKRHLHCSYRSHCYCSWHSCVCFRRETRSRIRSGLDILNLNIYLHRSRISNHCFLGQIYYYYYRHTDTEVGANLPSGTNRVKQVCTWVGWPGCVAFIARATAELWGSQTPTNWHAKIIFLPGHKSNGFPPLLKNVKFRWLPMLIQPALLEPQYWPEFE